MEKKVVNRKQLGKDLKVILGKYELKTNSLVGEKIIIDLFEVLDEYLINGDDIDIFGFGKFENGIRKGRRGRNPSTGEKIEIEDKRTLKFRPLGKLKRRLNE